MDDIEKLIRIQGAVNRDNYHLYIHIDMWDNYTWILYRMLDDFNEYMHSDNKPIMTSKDYTVDNLIRFLLDNNGIVKKMLEEEE